MKITMGQNLIHAQEKCNEKFHKKVGHQDDIVVGQGIFIVCPLQGTFASDNS